MCHLAQVAQGSMKDICERDNSHLGSMKAKHFLLNRRKKTFEEGTWLCDRKYEASFTSSWCDARHDHLPQYEWIKSRNDYPILIKFNTGEFCNKMLNHFNFYEDSTDLRTTLRKVTSVRFSQILARTSETSVRSYQATRHNISEDSHFQLKVHLFFGDTLIFPPDILFNFLLSEKNTRLRKSSSQSAVKGQNCVSAAQVHPWGA